MKVKKLIGKRETAILQHENLEIATRLFAYSFVHETIELILKEIIAEIDQLRYKRFQRPFISTT